MGEFIIFISTLFVFGTATALLVPYLRRHSKRLDQGVDHELLARLLEDMDQLSTRVTQLEEEVDFFRELRAPQTQGRLSPAREDDEGDEEL